MNIMRSIQGQYGSGRFLLFTFGINSIFLFDSLLGTLTNIQNLLMHVGPTLSAVLFIVAGIMYSIGQLLTPDKKAQFHTTSINIIIGAIVVAVLSVASGTLAVASAHLLSNLTISNVSS
jgi:hypothetical protein